MDGFTKDVLDMGDIGDKFRSFGWFVQTVNGHDIDEILDAVLKPKRIRAARPLSFWIQSRVMGRLPPVSRATIT